MKRNFIISAVLGLSAITLFAANSSTVALDDRFEDAREETLNALDDRFEDSHRENLNALNQQFEEAREGVLNS